MVIVVVKEVSGIEGHNTDIDDGGMHLRVLFRQVVDLHDGFNNGFQFHDDRTLTQIQSKTVKGSLSNCIGVNANDVIVHYRKL